MLTLTTATVHLPAAMTWVVWAARDAVDNADMNVHCAGCQQLSCD